MVELLMVVAILAAVFGFVVPRMTTIKTNPSLRAARQQLTAAFSAARSAALQKGKTSTLTLSGSSATVSVLSGLASKSATVNYDARGLMSPTPTSTLRYQLKLGSKADTLCISQAGLILKKGCAL